MDLYDMKAGLPLRVPWHLEADPHKGPRLRHYRAVPKQARHTDKFSMVRSLHHDTGDHFAGAHRMLTAKDMGVSGANGEPKFPGIGAIATRELGPRRRGIPAYIGVPDATSIGLAPGYFGGHMLGSQYNPFQTGAIPMQRISRSRTSTWQRG